MLQLNTDSLIVQPNARHRHTQHSNSAPPTTHTKQHMSHSMHIYTAQHSSSPAPTPMGRAPGHPKDTHTQHNTSTPQRPPQPGGHRGTYHIHTQYSIPAPRHPPQRGGRRGANPTGVNPIEIDYGNFKINTRTDCADYLYSFSYLSFKC